MVELVSVPPLFPNPKELLLVLLAPYMLSVTPFPLSVSLPPSLSLSLPHGLLDGCASIDFSFIRRKEGCMSYYIFLVSWWEDIHGRAALGSRGWLG